MNLYTKAKKGLLGKRAPTVGLVRVFTTRRWMAQPTYHITDPEGREIAMTRQDAVVACHALRVALKVNK